MKYKALVYFEDLQDKRRAYQIGDIYPRGGLSPTAERIEELATAKNRRGAPVIAPVEEAKESVVTATPSETEAETDSRPRRRKRKSE